MALPTIDNIEVPGVYEVSTDYVSIGSHDRSPSGTLMSNIVAVKKMITINCRPKDKSDFDPIISHLEDNLFGEVALDLEEYTETIAAVPTEATMISILQLMGTYNLPRELSLSFEEV